MNTSAPAEPFRLADLWPGVIAASSFAICNVLHGSQIMMSEDLSAALCRGINNWLQKEWLDRDPRLRASIHIPFEGSDLAVEEIERCAKDRRFVSVLMLVMPEMPIGRRAYWPIYAAAQNYEGDNSLTGQCISSTNYRCFGDCFMSNKRRFNFRCRDAVTRDIHDIINAAK